MDFKEIERLYEELSIENQDSIRQLFEVVLSNECDWAVTYEKINYDSKKEKYVPAIGVYSNSTALKIFGMRDVMNEYIKAIKRSMHES